MSADKSKILHIERIDRYNRPARKSIELDANFGDKAVAVLALLGSAILISDHDLDKFIASKQPVVQLASVQGDSTNNSVFKSNKSLTLEDVAAKQKEAKLKNVAIEISSSESDFVESNDDWVSDEIVAYSQLSNEESYILSGYISEKWKIPFSSAADVVLFSSDAGKEVGINPILILSIMARESAFKFDAKSSAGAEGLMQVLKKFHQERFPSGGNVQPKLNTLIGASILKEYLDMESMNLKNALQRYNGALGDESFAYTNKVLSSHKEFEQVVSSVRDEYKSEMQARKI